MYKKPTATVIDLAKKAFNYTGSKFQVFFDSEKYSLTNRWDEGTKYHAKLVCFTVDANDKPVFEISDLPECTTTEIMIIPKDFFIIEHCIFQGTDLGIRFYFRPDGIPEEEKAKLIKEAQDLANELTVSEQIVLAVHLGYQSSYSGIKDYRKHIAMETALILNADYDAAKQSLKDKGFLTSRNAVSLKGKQAKTGLPNLYDLKTKYTLEQTLGQSVESAEIKTNNNIGALENVN